jgi:hypothetical protein
MAGYLVEAFASCGGKYHSLAVVRDPTSAWQDPGHKEHGAAMHCDPHIEVQQYAQQVVMG